MTRADYDRYLTMFNGRDYDGFLTFWADRFDLRFAGVVLRTRDELKAFYAFLHAHLDEEIVLTRFVADEETVALEATVRITGRKTLTADALADRGLSGMLPLDVGQIVEMPQFIHYHLQDGKIVKAACVVVGPSD